MGKQWKQWQALFCWAPKSLQMVTAAMKLKDACSLEEKHWPTSVQFSSVQSLSRVWLFATLWTVARHVSLSITNSQSLLKLMSIELVMPSKHLIPFSSHLQSFPASGSFPVSQLFTSGGPSIGISASAFYFRIIWECCQEKFWKTQSLWLDKC